jgi:hypothetical protein
MSIEYNKMIKYECHIVNSINRLSSITYVGYDALEVFSFRHV